MNPYERSTAIDFAPFPEDEQRVAVLRVMTAADIPAGRVVDWFRETELWFEGQSGFRGPVQDVLDGEGTEHDDDIEYLYATLFGAQKVEFLRTTNPLWARKVATILETILSLIDKHDSEKAFFRQSFYAMGGGRPWKDLAVVDYAAARDEFQAAQEAAAAAEAERVAAAEAAEAAEQQRRDLRAAWVSLENSEINEAVASGDRARLVASLRAAIAQLENA